MIRDENTGRQGREKYEPAIPVEWQYQLAEIRSLRQVTPSEVGPKYQALYVMGEMDRR